MSDSEEEHVEKQLKLVFVGESCVGKTNVIRRFCYDEFSRQYNQTVGADFYIKRVVLPGKREVTLRITDIGGTQLNGNMLDKYLFNTNIIVIVYDITNSTSFDCMIRWMDTLKQLQSSAPIKAIIGNKCDLEHQRAVRLDRTRQFVYDNDLKNYLVSAKTGEAISASIMDIIAKYLGIPLTRIQRENQQMVVKAELVRSARVVRKPVVMAQTNSSVCVIQ